MARNRKARPKTKQTAREKSAEDSKQLDLNLDDIKKEHSDVDKQSYSEDDLIPTGSTMFNLACSDFSSGGWKKGSINTLPGESDSGKTVLAMSCLASCAADKRFDKYLIIMNNPESKGSFNLLQMFPPLVDRLDLPPGGNSQSIQQFGGAITALCKGKTPFIMALDSLDFLKGNSDHEKALKLAVKLADGNKDAIKDIQKTYGMEKAKVIKKVLGEVNDQINKTGSVLIIVQQLIENTKMKNKFDDPYRTNGGKAPFSSSTHSSRVLHGPKITKETKPKTFIQVGHWAKIVCKKNHLTGKKRDISFPIYEEYGIDDIESICIFLAENHWQMSAKVIGPGTVIEKSEFGNGLYFYEFIDAVWRSPEKYAELKQLVQDVWRLREKSLHTGRKRVF